MAYSFASASSQYLDTASSPVNGFPLTVACWVNVSTLGTVKMFMHVGAKSAADVAASRSRVELRTTATNAFNIRFVGSADASAISTTLATSGTWFHVCGVLASTTSRVIYVNGVSEATNTTTSTSPSAWDVVTIGSRWVASATSNFMDGRIAEAGIWNVALTADEIVSLAKGFACSKIRPQSLVFYAPLVRNLVDVRGGLTITNNNTATVADHPAVFA